MRLVSWNVNHLDVRDWLAGTGADLALLQEAPQHPTAMADRTSGVPMQVLPDDDAAWQTCGWERRPWRTAIVRLSEGIELRPIPAGDMTADAGELRVSRPGTLTAATVVIDGREVLTAVSVYAPWERPLGSDTPIWADASAHRLLSDLTPLIGRRLPIVVSGDWNILRGYGERGDSYYGGRYQTVFDRAEALGLTYIGPRFPGGRQALPWPSELPDDSDCVPTYYHSRQKPETATRQLDFVFASRPLANRVRAVALNDPADWGPSDHCRVLIDVSV
jgi:endonuclease/exonuclease/phosphatase family metal-dependent hydrolase